jgi:hypothetical protein
VTLEMQNLDWAVRRSTARAHSAIVSHRHEKEDEPILCEDEYEGQPEICNVSSQSTLSQHSRVAEGSSEWTFVNTEHSLNALGYICIANIDTMNRVSTGLRQYVPLKYRLRWHLDRWTGAAYSPIAGTDGESRDNS